MKNFDEINLINVKGNIDYLKEAIEYNNEHIELTFELRDSFNNPIFPEKKKINIKCKNVIFDYFMTLEDNIEALYLPIFLCIKTNINNIYLLGTNKKGKNKPVIYNLTALSNTNKCLIKKISTNELDIRSIDTCINSKDKEFKTKYNILKELYKKSDLKKICFNFGNCIKEKNYYLLPNLNNYTIYRAISPFKSSYLWTRVKPWKEKKNYIIYPGTITSNKDKNQVEFCKLLDKDVVKGYTIIFSGNQSKNSYCSKSEKNIRRILESKNISYKISPSNNNLSFFEDLLQSKLLIFYGVNPVDRVRVLTEGLYANLPFIVNDKITTIPDSYFNCGFKVKNNDTGDLNMKIKKILQKDWSLEPYLFSYKNFQIDKISEDIIKEINQII